MTEIPSPLPGKAIRFNKASFSSNQELVVAFELDSTKSGGILILDEEFKRQRTMPLDSPQFSVDTRGNHVVVGGGLVSFVVSIIMNLTADGRLRLLKLSGKMHVVVFVIQAHRPRSCVYDVRFHETMPIFASVGEDGFVRVFSLSGIVTFEIYFDAPVYCVVLSSLSTDIYCGLHGRPVSTVDSMSVNHSSLEMDSRSIGALSIMLSTNGDVLFAGTNQRSICALSAQTGVAFWNISTEGSVWSLTADDKYIYGGVFRSSIVAIDINSGLLQKFPNVPSSGIVYGVVAMRGFKRANSKQGQSTPTLTNLNSPSLVEPPHSLQSLDSSSRQYSLPAGNLMERVLLTQHLLVYNPPEQNPTPAPIGSTFNLDVSTELSTALDALKSDPQLKSAANDPLVLNLDAEKDIRFIASNLGIQNVEIALPNEEMLSSILYQPSLPQQTTNSSRQLTSNDTPPNISLDTRTLVQSDSNDIDTQIITMDLNLQALAQSEETSTHDSVPLDEDQFLDEIKLSQLLERLKSSDSISWQERVQALCQLIATGEQIVQQASGHDCVVIVGDTGAGKSTTINYLLGCTMQSKKESGRVKVSVVDPEQGGVKPAAVVIGHGTVSETVFPKVIRDPDIAPVLCDLPGFADNRGPEVSIANLATIRATFASCPSIKLFIILNFYSLEAVRGGGVKATIDVLNLLFGHSLSSFASSILIGVSRVPSDLELSDVQDIVRSLISEARLNVQIVIVDPLDRHQESCKRESILQLLGELPPISDPIQLLQAVLTNVDRQFLSDAADEITNRLRSLLKTSEYKRVVPLLKVLAQLSCIGHRHVDKVLTDVRDRILAHIQRSALDIQQIIIDRSAEMESRKTAVSQLRQLQHAVVLDTCFPSHDVSAIVTPFLETVRNMESNELKELDMKWDEKGLGTQDFLKQTLHNMIPALATLLMTVSSTMTSAEFVDWITEKVPSDISCYLVWKQEVEQEIQRRSSMYFSENDKLVGVLQRFEQRFSEILLSALISAFTCIADLAVHQLREFWSHVQAGRAKAESSAITQCITIFKQCSARFQQYSEPAFKEYIEELKSQLVQSPIQSITTLCSSIAAVYHEHYRQSVLLELCRLETAHLIFDDQAEKLCNEISRLKMQVICKIEAQHFDSALQGLNEKFNSFRTTLRQALDRPNKLNLQKAILPNGASDIHYLTIVIPTFSEVNNWQSGEILQQLSKIYALPIEEFGAKRGKFCRSIGEFFRVTNISMRIRLDVANGQLTMTNLPSYLETLESIRVVDVDLYTDLLSFFSKIFISDSTRAIEEALVNVGTPTYKSIVSAALNKLKIAENLPLTLPCTILQLNQHIQSIEDKFRQTTLRVELEESYQKCRAQLELALKEFSETGAVVDSIELRVLAAKFPQCTVMVEWLDQIGDVTRCRNRLVTDRSVQFTKEMTVWIQAKRREVLDILAQGAAIIQAKNIEKITTMIQVELLSIWSAKRFTRDTLAKVAQHVEWLASFNQEAAKNIIKTGQDSLQSYFGDTTIANYLQANNWALCRKVVDDAKRFHKFPQTRQFVNLDAIFQQIASFSSNILRPAKEDIQREINRGASFSLTSFTRWMDFHHEFIGYKPLKREMALQDSKLFELCYDHLEVIVDRSIASNGFDSALMALSLIKLVTIASKFDGNKIFMFKAREKIFAGVKERNCVQLGTELRGHVSNPEYGETAKKILDTFPEFEVFNIQFFNSKASRISEAEVLEGLAKMPNEPAVNTNSLKNALVAYNEVVKAELRKIVDRTYDVESVKQQAFALAKQLKPFRSKLFLAILDTSKLLGYISVQWTYLVSGKKMLEGDVSTLKIVHPPQIIGVMRLIGLETNSPIQNHLCQIKTGEGKSVCLGILASLMGLLGATVDVVCYSSYLSERDFNAFKELFQVFGVLPVINYTTIEKLVHIVRNRHIGDVYNLVKEYLLDKPISSRPDTTKAYRVLLIDEVDVFFGESFYGHTMGFLVTIDTPTAQELARLVWDERGTQGLTLESVLASSPAKQLLWSHPKLNNILKTAVKEMIRDVQQFVPIGTTTHNCHVENNKIGYLQPETSSVSFTTHYGYQTMFAYLHYSEFGKGSQKIDSISANNMLGVELIAGRLLYSELSNFFDLSLGITGTLDCLSTYEKSILESYNFNRRTFMPPLFKKVELTVDPIELYGGTRDAEYYGAIRQAIREKYEANRPCLVVFENSKNVDAFIAYCKDHPILGSTFAVLSDLLHNDTRDSMIDMATRAGKVTLMPRSYGRGCDFVCRDSETTKNGGVHVIQTFFSEYLSEEVQIRGRTTRQDDHGSYQQILFLDDLEKFDAHDRAEQSASEMEWPEYLATKREEYLEKTKMNQIAYTLENNKPWHDKTLEMVEAIYMKNAAIVQPILESFQ